MVSGKLYNFQVNNGDANSVISEKPGGERGTRNSNQGNTKNNPMKNPPAELWVMQACCVQVSLCLDIYCIKIISFKNRYLETITCFSTRCCLPLDS